MIIFLECATITDDVNFFAQADKSRLRPDELALLKELSIIRTQLKAYSVMDNLINRVQSGDNIILKKVAIDKYHKSQVDLMKLLVRLNQPCRFSYLPVYGNVGINTAGMDIKEQLALEMITSRYTSSAMYHLGAFSAISGLLQTTKDSYDPKYKGLAGFNNNVQMALSYFKEAYYPIGRFSKVYPWVERLMTGQSQQVLQARRDVWEANRLLVECNVGYLLLEKLRVLNEFGKCRDGARNIVDKLMEAGQLLAKHGPVVKQSIRDYLSCATIFFKAYALVHHLKENEKKKVDEDYGFAKKEFRQMIMENLEAAQHIAFLSQQLRSLKQASDYYEFAKLIFDEVFVKYAQLCTFIFSVKTDNSQGMYEQLTKPSIEAIWSAIPSYDLIKDI